MADGTYYAWSPIHTGDGDKAVVIARGDKVTKASAMVDDVGFQQLIDSGAIRARKIPDMPPEFQGSIREFYLQELTEASGSGDDDDVLDASEALADAEAPPPASIEG